MTNIPCDMTFISSFCMSALGNEEQCVGPVARLVFMDNKKNLQTSFGVGQLV